MEEQIDIFAEYLEEWLQNLELGILTDYVENPKTLREDIEQILIDEGVKYEPVDIEELADEATAYILDIIQEAKETVLNDLRYGFEEALSDYDPNNILTDEDILRFLVKFTYEFI